VGGLNHENLHSGVKKTVCRGIMGKRVSRNAFGSENLTRKGGWKKSKTKGRHPQKFSEGGIGEVESGPQVFFGRGHRNQDPKKKQETNAFVKRKEGSRTALCDRGKSENGSGKGVYPGMRAYQGEYKPSR